MKWVKPNGTEIETLDTEEIIAYCESIGWERADASKKPRRRPRKQAVDSPDEPEGGDE
jgi:hypothetical protein